MATKKSTVLKDKKPRLLRNKNKKTKSSSWTFENPSTYYSLLIFAISFIFAALMSSILGNKGVSAEQVSVASFLDPTTNAIDIKENQDSHVSISSVEISSEQTSDNEDAQVVEELVDDDHKIKTNYQPSTISPTLNVPENAQVATFAAGCFWGVEHIFRRYFAQNFLTNDNSLNKNFIKRGGLIDAKVGYSGGRNSSIYPSYKQVCKNNTGHAEVLQISFDPKIVSYKDLVDFFFRIHDPTTLNQQGPDDFGEQYRSAIFYHNEEQHKIANDILKKYQHDWYDPAGLKIVTQVEPIKVFWDAEVYHQLYLKNNPEGYMCPSHHLRTEPPLPKKDEL
ncbi:uncharacterized protein SAPINGB_P005422 [Magnusiomyces paraingens]|uniref:peptide-methionine (S)-S-oxide reductase n=1 Tax=Magnusiomyces paraingens TaxID=2606893 RepID=A0A5E8C217_9ASCO|nr:uncharacterized protein SAPINGB_P005422 [Saprochaete ingens]VVT56935.1 unnamed protein product [Saprochaete ingens]